MSPPLSVKTVRCSGTPYQIGLAHGTAVAAQIHKNVATYTAFFDETVGITWAEARARAVDQFAGRLERSYPAILEEMQGIADGVNSTGGNALTRDDVLTLNVRSEIALTNYTDGCTSLSQVAPEHSKKKVFLAQNWDWLEELHEGMVSFDMSPAEGVDRLVFLGEAGIVGKIGMNSAGFGLCMNAIRSGAQGTEDCHLPVHVMSRRLLQYAASFDDALAILSEFSVASCINLMLADRSGKHADMECSPYGHARIDATTDGGNGTGFVAHTNHLYGTAAGGRPERLVDHPADNSFARLERMQKLTKEDATNNVVVSFESLRARLSDLEGAPYAICRSRPPGAVGMERMVTLCTILMELTTGQGKVSIGRPCEKGIPVVEWQL